MIPCLSKEAIMNDFNYDQNAYGTEFKDHILEQYKLYVEMADRVSERRMKASSFFLSVNAFLITALSYLSDNNLGFMNIFICILGVILTAVWGYLLNSYRQLNSGKYKVIHFLESQLPFSPYDAEWETLGHGKDKKKYWPLSHLELVLPIAFSVIYVIVFFVNIV